jgi:tryptophan-rich sensory protein
MFQWLSHLFHRPKTSTREKWVSGLIATVYIFGLGFLGGRMNPSTQAFYDALQKPSLNPPNWVFPVAWTILFTLIAWSGYQAWNHYTTERLRRIFAYLYAVNGLLVYLWSYAFFERQSIQNALFIIVAMVIVIELMILTAFKSNHRAAYALLPYFLWVLFATYLNVSIVALNP